MYKPNGEERMTEQEELQHRKAIAERKLERARTSPESEALKTSIYAMLAQVQTPREEVVGL